MQQKEKRFSTMKNKYYTPKFGQIEIDNKLGEGGEGIVFALKDMDEFCAKIYQKGMKKETKRKLEIMCESPPTDPQYEKEKVYSIAWPVSLIYKDEKMKNPVGFIMPKIPIQKYAKICAIFDRSSREKINPFITWKYLYHVCMNLSSVVAAIHEKGYVIGDMNDENILVNKENGYICIIDCDSFQVKDKKSSKVYRCGVGREIYTAPEYIGKIFSELDRTPESDNFALATILFRTLMGGFSPYQAKDKCAEEAPGPDQKVKRGYFPYFKGHQDKVEPPDGSFDFDILPENIQELFIRCFVDGHKEPKKRPTAKEWLEAFIKNKENFVQCTNNPLHLYLNHLKSCPWCKIRERDKKEHFPAFQIGEQIPVSQPNVEKKQAALQFLRDITKIALEEDKSKRIQAVKNYGKVFLNLPESKMNQTIQDVSQSTQEQYESSEYKQSKQSTLSVPSGSSPNLRSFLNPMRTHIAFIGGGILGLKMNSFFPFFFQLNDSLISKVMIILAVFLFLISKTSFLSLAFSAFAVFISDKISESFSSFFVCAMGTLLCRDLVGKPYISTDLSLRKLTVFFAVLLLFWSIFLYSYWKKTENLGVFDSMKTTKFLVEIENQKDLLVGPDLKAYKIQKIPAGRVISVIDQKSGWYKVSTGGKVGWIQNKSTKPINLNKSFVVKITKNRVNVREKPSQDSRVISQFSSGSTAVVIGQSGNWYKILFEMSGELSSGWIHRSLTSLVR